MKRFLKIIVVFLAFATIIINADSVQVFSPSKAMRDVDGALLKAYDGGVTFYNGIYYWYGEYKNGRIETDEIACYSSTDLYNWKYRGSMIAGLSQGPLANYHSLERPHVL